MSNDHSGLLRIADEPGPRAPRENDGAYTDGGGGGGSGGGLAASIPAALSELRRRWKLAAFAFALIVGPSIAYAVMAVPQYTSRGVIQVSAQGGLASANPLMELAGGGSSTEVNTEVQIITRRDFLARVFRGLRLHVADPNQARRLSKDLSVSVDGQSPVDPRLRALRASLGQVEVAPERYTPVRLRVTGLAAQRLELTFAPDSEDSERFEVGLGEAFAGHDVTLRFDAMPVPEGETFDVSLLGDGLLLEELNPRLRVAALGTTREPTNLVRISFSHPDRHTAQAVVQGIMDRYLAQSLEWQTEGASTSAEFVRERLSDVRGQLSEKEASLSEFAENEHAVQLDTQARVTIENSAEIEATKMQLDLEAQVLGNLSRSLRRSTNGRSADLTAGLVDDPVLTGAIAGLTEVETRHATLKATLTPDHPKLGELEARIGLQQKKVAKLVGAAKRNVSAKRAKLVQRLEETNAALASYPEKELQLARLMRDVEVSQRLYAFLLEKAQEAEILEASTTTDKRTVDAASLPHRRSAPSRARVVATGSALALLFAFAMVYVARTFQRRVATVEAARELVPYPAYATIPLVSQAGSGDRLTLDEIWKESYNPVCEAFRALCVSVSLTPVKEDGRGRVLLMTSSFAGEGKSTVAANLAVSLAKSGASVLLIDLDLRKPVQHRIWKLRRSPGYSDVMAEASDADALAAAQSSKTWDVNVLPAGTRLPDTLGALLNPRLPRLVEAAARTYDYVIVDGAPMFVGDAPVLARLADLVLLVVRPGLVERRRLFESVTTLSRMGAQKGVVFNGVSRSTSDDYYYNSDYRYAEAAPDPKDAAKDGESAKAKRAS